MDVNEELKFLGKFKKKKFGGVGGGQGGWVGGGGQSGCERRIEVFVKIRGGGVSGRGGDGFGGSGWM